MDKSTSWRVRLREEAYVPKDLDKVIHERARLKIVSALAAQFELDFVSLKKLLDLSDGNLNAHMRVLEENKYISVTKKFVGRKPKTLYRLTPKGRSEFKKYINELDAIVRKFSS